MSNPATTHILIALPCEAKPLIGFYQLKRRVSAEPFPLYEKDGVILTVTGVGKVSMAAGVAFSHQFLNGTRNAVWLNVGIAGHPTHPIGSAFITHKITDADTRKRWYPPQPFTPPCASETVTTVSLPLAGYPDSCLYDMEASAFYDIATRFSTSELVQSLKIVSDNTAKPIGNISPRHVATLMESHLQTIDTLLNEQQGLAEIVIPQHPEWYSTACELWRLTHNQKIQLKEIARHWQVLSPNHPPNLEAFPKTNDGKQILGLLKTEIKNRQMHLNFE